MTNSKEYHVFISYSRKDTKIISKLVADLEEIGLNVWLDKTQMPIGTLDWENSIRDAIKSAIGVIYSATPNARDSRFVRGELQIADDNNIRIFPVWLDGDKYSDCVPLGFTYVQNVDLRNEKYDIEFKSLVNSLIQLLDERICKELQEKEISKENPKLSDILNIFIEPFHLPEYEWGFENSLTEALRDAKVKDTDKHSATNILIEWGIMEDEVIYFPWEDKSQPEPFPPVLVYSLTKLGHYLRENLK